MTFTRIVLTLLLAALPSVGAGQSIEDLQQSIRSTSDVTVRGQLYKQLGDAYAAKDDAPQAARAYSRALRLVREQMTPAERLKAATYLSWDDRLGQSRDELRLLLDRDSQNTPARIQLARVLSWNNEYAAALKEAELVLKAAPTNREALLIKADALQWWGRPLEAIPIYRDLVSREDDYDARVGLARSQLALKDRTSAVAGFRGLPPPDARQKREADKLADAIATEASPALDFRYSYYEDSDENRVNRYTLGGTGWLGNLRFDLYLRHTEADDRTRDNTADELLISVYMRLTDRLAAGGGIGFARIEDTHTSDFLTGHARLDARLFAGGTGGVYVFREMLTDTAELIDNRIRTTSAGLYLYQPFTDRLSGYASYTYKDYSDRNHANDLQLVSQYVVFPNPRIAIGHRFRFLDYDRQSGGGYFDPNDYVANRFFVSFLYDKPHLYAFVEAFAGYETFRRNRVNSDNVIQGASAKLGIKPTTRLAIELTGEGSNFSAGSAAGFSYFMFGARLILKF